MGFFSELYGRKPELPQMPTVSAQESQRKALQGNLDNMGLMTSLGSNVNQFTRDEIGRMREAATPGFSRIQDLGTRTVESMMRGELPTDVSNLLQRNSAARSLAGGYGGSGMQRSLNLRDLGLTSLDMTQKGLSSAMNWLQVMEAPYKDKEFNIASMMFTPTQQAAFDVEERDKRYQWSWMNEQLQSMSDPTTRGLWNFGSSLGGAIGSPGPGLGSIGQNAAGMFGSVAGLGGGGGFGGMAG